MKFWGKEVSIDLTLCNPETIRSKKKLEKFIIELCEIIKVKRFRKPIIVDFGKDPRVSGYSLVQLIETSLVSGHFANQSNSAYINVFSCKEFNHHKVEDFCRKFFEAKSIQSIVNYRV